MWRAVIGAVAIATAAAAQPPPARPPPPLPAGGETHAIEAGGVQRTYHLVVPPGVRRPAPLLVVLHGGSTKDGRSSLGIGLPELGARDGVVTVYPDGLILGWNDGRRAQALRELRGAPDDVGFIVQMIDELVARGVADRRRVAVMGGSNGGMMALRLACERPDRFAAVAVFNAQFSQEQAADCRTGKPLPLLIMNGTGDPRIPYRGGEVKGPGGEDLGRVLSTEDTARWWRGRNRCSDRAEMEALTGIDPRDGTAVRAQRWSCALGSEVVLYTVEGGEHRLPGARQPAASAPPSGLRGIDLIWAFLRRHL